MFGTSLFRATPSVVRLDLDELATLEVPSFLHREPSPELQLPVARRLRRRPYIERLTPPDQTTYYLVGRDYSHFGGREIPVLLRVTLYADDAPLSEAPDSAYIHFLQQTNFHRDEQYGHLLAQARPAGPGLWYAENPESVPGWFSVKQYTRMHLILTDQRRKTRLFLSVSDREMSRAQAEQLLRQVQRSLVREPAALAQYLAYAAQVGPRLEQVKRANAAANQQMFNQQLTAAGLPPLPAAPFHTGRFVDVGQFFYGLTHEQELVFVARLGTSARRPETAAEGFAGTTAGWLNAFPSPERLVWPQPVPAGHWLHLRRGCSPPLSWPPEEVASSQPAVLVRAAANAAAQVQQQPGFVSVRRTAPAYWDLNLRAIGETAAVVGQRADYRSSRLHFAGGKQDFQLRYVGLRTAEAQAPQAVFMLTTAVTFTNPATETVLAVDAATGGRVQTSVADKLYQVRIEPVEAGYVTLEEVQ